MERRTAVRLKNGVLMREAVRRMPTIACMCRCLRALGSRATLTSVSSTVSDSMAWASGDEAAERADGNGRPQRRRANGLLARRARGRPGAGYAGVDALSANDSDARSEQPTQSCKLGAGSIAAVALQACSRRSAAVRHAERRIRIATCDRRDPVACGRSSLLAARVHTSRLELKSRAHSARRADRLTICGRSRADRAQCSSQ